VTLVLQAAPAQVGGGGTDRRKGNEREEGGKGLGQTRGAEVAAKKELTLVLQAAFDT
jgi:hypothetical protein